MQYLLHNAAEENKYSEVLLFIQDCLMRNGPCYYTFFVMDEVKLVRKVSSVQRGEAEFFDMNSNFEPAESQWNFSLARMDSCTEAGYFVSCGMGVKHQSY